MTVTTEFRVTDGGSVDAAIAKVEKLRNVLKDTGSGSGEKITAGAKAIKSAADAAEGGTAKFQKATGALQNLAAATGNPLLMKGASMFNGLAAGLNKVESGALGAAAGMRVLMVAGGVVIAAITAALAAFKMFNSVLEASTTNGKYYSSAIEDAASATEDLAKATRDYQVLHTPESMIKLADAMDSSAEKVRLLQAQMEEAKNTTWSWSKALEVVAKMANRGWQNIKAFFGNKEGLAALNLAEAKAQEEATRKAAGGLTSDQLRAAGERAKDATKANTSKGGKSAAEVALDATNKQLDITLKLKDAEVQRAQIAADSFGTYDAILANKIEAAAIEKAQVQYAKNMLEAAGNTTAEQAAALVLENEIASAKQKTINDQKAAEKELSEILRDRRDAEINALQWRTAFETETSQLKIDSLENELRYAESIKIIEAGMAIAEQASIDRKRLELETQNGLLQAYYEKERLTNEGKLSESEILAKYQSQVSMVMARNTAQAQGIELQKQAALELDRQRTLMEDMTTLAETMAVAFGNIGKAIGATLVIATKMQEQDKTYAKKKELLMKDEKKNAAEIAKVDAKHTIDQINGISEISAATKDMFAEKTAAHKAFSALEKVTSAMSMALQAQQLAQTLAQLPSKIASGVATLFEQGGWAGFAGAAAFLAIMAAFGVGSSKSINPTIPKSSVDGSTGAVLGGSTEQSKSLVEGIDKLNDTNYQLLNYNRGKMYNALVAIRDNIGSFMAGVSRAGILASQTETGSSEKLFGLLSGSTSIKAAGLNISGSITGGVTTAEAYETVEKKKSALGITYDKDTSTTVTKLSNSLKNDIEGIFKSMGDALVSGAEIFGSTVSSARDAVNRIAFDLSISTKGMSTEDIMKALEAKVGTELDRAINQVLPGFANVAEKYQKVGESSLDFLVRATHTADNIMTGLESIGLAVDLTGTTAAEFSLHLAEMSGGIDKFNENVSFYADNFLTEAERLAPVQRRVTDELRRLGLSSVDTREEFKNVVLGLNLATESGKEMYASLMNLAPAFAAVYEESEKVLTVEEKLAELRDKELDLKNKITSAYESESSAIKATISTIGASITNLLGYKTNLSLSSNSTLSPVEKYTLAKNEAMKLAAAAAAGDKDAIAKLPTTLETFLTNSRAINASGAAYTSDFNYVQRILDTTVTSLETQKSDAENQLDVLNNSYSALNIIKEQNYTMVELMRQLADVQAEEVALVTEQQKAVQAEELRSLNRHLENLRKEQQDQTEETVRTLKSGFMGLFTSTRTSTNSKQQTPLVNNPGYYIWNESTGGA